jgi:hypothetical protein
MFCVKDFSPIMHHLQKYSRICRFNNQGWLEIFCPYCGDASRSTNPNHGHMFIAPDSPLAHCFKCESIVSLKQLLIDINFTDAETLHLLDQFSTLRYYSYKTIRVIKPDKQKEIKNKIEKIYENFINNNPEQYKKYINYINYRLLDTDPIEFNIYPAVSNNHLVCQFENYYGEYVTSRVIDSSSVKYLKTHKVYYYFQDILKINKFNSIVICEGIFDLINLYNFYPSLRHSFFISMNGSSYFNSINDIVSSYLLIGKKLINIIFDRNVPNKKQLKYSIIERCRILNPEIELRFYMPTKTKDVSELMDVATI